MKKLMKDLDLKLEELISISKEEGWFEKCNSFLQENKNNEELKKKNIKKIEDFSKKIIDINLEIEKHQIELKSYIDSNKEWHLQK